MYGQNVRFIAFSSIIPLVDLSLSKRADLSGFYSTSLPTLYPYLLMTLGLRVRYGHRVCVCVCECVRVCVGGF